MYEKPWSFKEDQQWASGPWQKNWDTDHTSLTWMLQVTTERYPLSPGVLSDGVKMGGLRLQGSASGELTIALDL